MKVDRQARPNPSPDIPAVPHSPGWCLEYDGSVVIDGQVCIGRTSCGPDNAPVAVQWANAFLIAGAPDLLAALRAVEWGGSADCEVGGYEPACPSCDAAKSSGEHHADCKLRAAIAKATGGGQ
jgi:hypothetical protein